MATGWSGVDPATWAGSKDKLLTALLRDSVEELAKAAALTERNGGLVPVKSGNLGRSVVVSDKAPDADAAGVEYESQRDVAGGIGDILPGKDVFIGWTPIYARRVNSGFVGVDSLGRAYNQAGAGFAEATAAKWPAIVAEQAAKLAGRK